MKAAVLVIDMLNEFVYGNLSVPQARELVSKIRKILTYAREHNMPIFYVCDAHKEGDPELKLWGPHAMKGSKNAQIIDELKPNSDDKIIEKRTYSGFFGTNLFELLKERNIDTLILVGIYTHICVQHTAADAFYHGFNIIIPKDATIAPTRRDYENGLNTMRTLYGANIVTSDDLLLNKLQLTS